MLQFYLQNNKQDHSTRDGTNTQQSNIERKYFVLFNRQIHNAVSLVQEVIHSIKREKMSAFPLKLDLSKAYDRLSCTFIHLLLIQIGMPMEVVE